MKTTDLLEYSKGTDTRNQSELNIYKIVPKLAKKEYIALNKKLKEEGCYYSKFKGGFICKSKLELESIDLETTSTKKETSANVKYMKKLTDYISIEEYEKFLKDFAKQHPERLWNYSYKKSIEEAIKDYEAQLLLVIPRLKEDDSYENELRYVREAILHKSLGYKKEDLRTNGGSLKYYAIWDKLPIIEGLEITNRAYTSMWGYDQTNVDIARQLNKRVWGLDVFRVNRGEYMLVRMKDNRFHDNVRYFSYDPNPEKTFERDASQTGQYR